MDSGRCQQLVASSQPGQTDERPRSTRRALCFAHGRDCRNAYPNRKRAGDTHGLLQPPIPALGNQPGNSAKAALTVALETLLKLFAPFLPFVTEEVWSWTNDDSIHTSSWPQAADLRAFGGDATSQAAVAD
ncbi:MAG: hypothetical protein EBY45_14500, partial [Gammaproteobacteria bacterium]|nr:hypothetical protein [Gammaproteobacteria bacterium]